MINHLLSMNLCNDVMIKSLPPSCILVSYVMSTLDSLYNVCVRYSCDMCVSVFQSLQGSGPGGRVIAQDVSTASPAVPTPVFAPGA